MRFSPWISLPPATSTLRPFSCQNSAQRFNEALLHWDPTLARNSSSPPSRTLRRHTLSSRSIFSFSSASPAPPCPRRQQKPSPGTHTRPLWPAGDTHQDAAEGRVQAPRRPARTSPSSPRPKYTASGGRRVRATRRCVAAGTRTRNGVIGTGAPTAARAIGAGRGGGRGGCWACLAEQVVGRGGRGGLGRQGWELRNRVENV